VVASVADGPKNGPCLRGVSDDGDGTFLLGFVTGGTFGPPASKYDFFRIDGGGAVRIGEDRIGAGDEGGVQVFSQPSGFSAFNVSGFDGGSVLGTWSHEGTSISTTQIAAGEDEVAHIPSSAVGIDPSGGTAAVKTYFSYDRGWITTYQRFDKHGVAETGEVQVDTGEHRVGGVGVAFSGHALILTSSGNPNWEARWVARDGSPLSKTFTLQGPANPRFQFLRDGSLALGFVNDFSAPATNFVYRIEDGAAVAGPLPDWLSSRAGNQLYVVRSGKAYATWGGGGRCGSDLEILAASSGKSCGCVKVPDLTAATSVGRDGSLIVPGGGAIGSGCSYDLYTKLLR
jgi:hypothetical protein